MMLCVACASTSNTVRPSDNTRMLEIMLFLVRKKTHRQYRRVGMFKAGSRIMLKIITMLVLR